MSYAPPSVRAMRGRAAAVRRPAPAAPAPAREAACAACEWNHGWRCEHAGCRVCPGKQRLLGGEPLRALLAEASFRCPMRKF